MTRFAGVSAAQVSRMFPRVEELWTLHAALLYKLRQRQRISPCIATIADILSETFAPPAQHKLKAAYGKWKNLTWVASKVTTAWQISLEFTVVSIFTEYSV